MDEIKRNVPKTFRDRVSTVRYVIVLTLLAAVAAAGYTFLPEAEVSAQVEKAAIDRVGEAAPEVATQEMIDYALNLRTASGYTVYAEKGVVDRGSSEIRGAKADALRSAEGKRSTKELSNSIDAMRQLPCTSLKSGALGGRSFGPGVYCLDSAELAGEMTLNGGGNAAGTYIFRVAGTLNAKSGSSIRLEDGAQGGNVYFVASEVEIGDNAAFRANVLSSGTVKVGRNATVTDKVMALGKVELDNSALLGGTTGTMEICKRQQLPVTAANDLSNQIFHFTVSGSQYSTPATALRVPVGSCSAPFDVTAGPQTVTELNSGTLITPSTGTFTGGFQLYNVLNVTPTSPSQLLTVNLALRTASVNMVAGGVNTQLTLEFYNREAITGFIEICKRAASGPGQFNPGPGPAANPNAGGDPDVTGFFQYTIEDVYSVNTQNPYVRTLQIFTIPVGQCTGPIAVTKADPAPIPGPPDPRWTFAYVSELPRAGAYLESVIVQPASRGIGGPVLGTIVGASQNPADPDDDVFIPAPGGGYQDVQLVESESAANETLITFVNRSNPGTVKVCKVAGPGIPINTLFTFTVTGIGATTAAHPQAATYGPVSRTFDVRAGDPAQGGTCEMVPGLGAPAPGYSTFQTFVNGTPVIIYENGISVNNTIPQNPGELRVGNIRVFGSRFATSGEAGFTSPFLTPGSVIPGGPVAQTFTTGNIAVPILDDATITIPVNASPNATITDINARVRLDHTWDEDLDLSLINPAGTAIDLSSDNGGSGDNYGSGTNNCSGTPTTFDDEAATLITAGVAPFAGSFRPEQALSTFDGTNQNGTWRLRVTDDEALLAGTVGCVSLDILANLTAVGKAAVIARLGVVEVEFTNYRFNPTMLKVCKIGLGSTLGETFNFTVAMTNPTVGGSNPGFIFPGGASISTTVAVIAGPGGPQDGNCVIVNGTGFPGASFNQGSTITITEAAGNVTTITCPSCGPGGFVGTPATRTAVLSGPNGLVAGINSVVFTNAPAPNPADRAVKFDFDGDKKADTAVFTPANGNWSYLASGQSNALKQRTFGVNGDKLVAADYDGDGKTDYAVYRPSEGRWFIQGTTNIFEWYNWGEPGDIPQVGDYDGDGKADLVVWRPSNGHWYMRNSSEGFRIFQFGIPSDKPHAADYDGDGRTDVGIFRDGTWYILQSGSGFRVTQFGQTGDVPVAADYDGDGAADLAVFRSGTWYMLSATAYTVRAHGQAGDVPVPADYDGDRKTDIAVFRAAEGKWYIKKSGLGESSSFDTVSFGSSTDAVVQAQ